MRFTLKQLAVFHMAAQELNLTRAAEKLFLSTPAVSKNIRNLEAACGCSLFGISGKRIYLTEAGSKLFKSLKPLRQQLDQFENTIQNLSAKPDEPIRLSITNTFQPLVIPWLKRFSDQHPNIQFRLSIQTWQVQHERLNQKKPALYLTGEGLFNEEYETEVIKQFRLILVTHASHPLAKQKATPQQLKHEQFLVPYTQSGSSKLQAEIMASWGIEAPRIYLDSYGAILSAVRAGMGMALLPDVIVQNSLRQGKIIQLNCELPDAAFDLQFCHPKSFALNQNEILIQHFLRKQFKVT